jgi:hypothetical protein
MVNIQESRDFEFEDLVADRNQPENIAEQEDPGANLDDSEPSRKHKQLLCNAGFLNVRSKFKSQRYCLCSSKAVVLILAWNLIVSFSLVGFWIPPSTHLLVIIRQMLLS